jgi:hypothetical protein
MAMTAIGPGPQGHRRQQLGIAAADQAVAEGDEAGDQNDGRQQARHQRVDAAAPGKQGLSQQPGRIEADNAEDDSIGNRHRQRIRGGRPDEQAGHRQDGEWTRDLEKHDERRRAVGEPVIRPARVGALSLPAPSLPGG